MTGRVLVMGALLLPSLAQADVLICEFTPTNCPEIEACAPFDMTINTHHGTDAPYIQYGGIRSSVLAVPGEDENAEVLVTLGQSDREVIALFSNFSALHTRHAQQNGTPVATSATGQCVNFY